MEQRVLFSATSKLSLIPASAFDLGLILLRSAQFRPDPLRCNSRFAQQHPHVRNPGWLVFPTNH
jgi:hypothetical protein